MDRISYTFTLSTRAAYSVITHTMLQTNAPATTTAAAISSHDHIVLVIAVIYLPFQLGKPAPQLTPRSTRVFESVNPPSLVR
jgi:hypothetical protein